MSESVTLRRLADESHTPLTYAQRLASYIRDPSTIRARTLDEFGRAPSLGECANLRARYERREQREKRTLANRSREITHRKTKFRCGHPYVDENIIFMETKTLCWTCEAERIASEERARLARLEIARFKAEQAARMANDVLKASEARRMLLAACDYYEIPVSRVFGPCRKRPTSRARQVTAYAVKEKLGWSYPRIAELIGYEDHTTARYGHLFIRARLKSDREVADAVMHVLRAGEIFKGERR